MIVTLEVGHEKTKCPSKQPLVTKIQKYHHELDIKTRILSNQCHFLINFDSQQSAEPLSENFRSLQRQY